MLNKMLFSALEMEAGLIKFAQAQDAAGQRKIAKLIIKKLPSQSEKEIIASLKSITDEVKGRIGYLTLIIPGHKVTVRFLRFPSVDEKEITGMVELQSTKELPFHKEELISDYLISEQTKDGYTKVALVIVHRDVVNGYLDILNKANLKPQRITFSVEASLNWFRSAFGPERLTGCYILLDLDSDHTDFSIFSNSNLQYSRGLSFGITQLQSNPDLKPRLIRELRRTIEGYLQQEGKEKPQRLLLTQVAAIPEQLRSHLEQEFNLPTEIVSPFGNLPYQKEVDNVRYKDELSLLRVLGAALKISGKKLNLLPANLRQAQNLALRAKKIKKVFSLSLGIILLMAAIFLKKIYNQQAYLSSLNQEIANIAQVSGNVEKMLKVIGLIEERRKIEGSAIDALRELHQLTPAKISFSSLDYEEEDRTIALQGASENMSEIINFTGILEKSPFFRNVQLKYVSEKKAKAEDFIAFRIECNLEK